MTLVIIPSDPIEAYERKGTSSWLEKYFNPTNYFENVFVLSPLEKVHREVYGLKIIPVKSNSHYKDLIKSIKPDVIRAYGGYWASDFAIYNKSAYIPIIVGVHDTSSSLIHKSIKFSDHVICMTKVVQEETIKRTGINKRHTTILGNRVDTSLFKYYGENNKVEQIRSKLPKGKFILHVGRKTFQKNIETLINSLKYLPENNFIVFIGLGEKENYFELAKKISVDHRCFWIDSVDNSELPYWYNACDLFCVLSRWEGFGLVFIEAAASEVLILTSDIAPMNEILDNASCFFIKEYEDPNKVAERISEIFSLENAVTLEVRKNARSKSLKYDCEKIASKEVEIYKNVIKEGKQKDGIEYYIWKIWFKTTTDYTRSIRWTKKSLKQILQRMITLVIQNRYKSV